MISYWMIILTFSLAECFTTHLQWETCIVGTQLLYLYDRSFLQCFQDCKRRPDCFSFSYYRGIQLCEINNVNASLLTQECSGYVFTQISDWQIETDPCSPNCAAGEWCDVAGQECVLKECGVPPYVGNTVVLGNKRAVGSIVKYMCTNNRATTVSAQCNDDGAWDSLPTCPKYPVEMEGGARWRAFWWYTAGSGWPADQTDVLGAEYDSCDPTASYCFGRLPLELSENGAELLAKDSAGTIYRWTFDASNPTAHAVWLALHDHSQTLSGEVCNQNNPWNPTVVSGSPPINQDCFMYRMEHGVISLLLDDDNCDCKSSLSIGHGMCNAGFSTTYGPENIFGADLLHDPACQTPSPDNDLTLFFRDEDDCVGVDCGPGLSCIDEIGTYRCGY